LLGVDLKKKQRVPSAQEYTRALKNSTRDSVRRNGSSIMSSSLHQKEHYNYPRKMTTPTHPVEGDFLPIKTEEALFGLLFGWRGLSEQVECSRPMACKRLVTQPLNLK
jgi:hypothetical protein